MPVSATSARRARFFSCCPLLLLVLLLAAGCRSSQSAYQFRPAPVSVAQRPIVAEPAVLPAGASAGAAATVAPTVRPSAASPRPLKPRQLRQQQVRAVAQAGARPMVSFRPKSAAQQVRRVAGPRHAAEVGLGTTVLGVLGLVVLPVALLGLLIWGGPVWAILAGLAALAVLVAYLDPFK